MRLYLDLASGIAGDMALGALVDLGVPLDWLTAQLQKVLTGFELRCEIVFRHHLRAVNLHVDVTDHTAHRHFRDIKQMILDADLPDRVQQNSLAAFERIARAESRIHGKDLDQVHFHEIGGIDSLVDIIGTFLAVDYLGVTQVAASKIPLGSGFIECAHGRIPVPVPATLAILKGLPVTGSDAKTEIVTPTGAAIVATLATAFGPMPDMEIRGIGYGAGKRDTGSLAPNLVRMVLGAQPLADDAESASHILQDEVVVIKTNVDDMNPEITGFLLDQLLDSGALDVTLIPVHMKKNRPGTCIEVICAKPDLDRLAGIIFSQTTAIGLRYTPWHRMILARESLTLDTKLGPMAVKKIVGPQGDVRYVPEYEACRKAALALDLPLREVYDRVTAELTCQGCDQDPLDRGQDRLYKDKHSKSDQGREA